MPWIAGVVSAGLGIYQAVKGNSDRKKSEKALQDQVNNAKPNQSILDYYNKALSKYDANPYTSVSYQQQQNQNQNNLSTGIYNTQNKRLGLSAIGGLVQQSNDASARAAAGAESQQNNALGRVGQAAGLKTNEEQKKFDMLYNLQAMKAGQSASTENTGLSNIFSGLSNAAYSYGTRNNRLY